MALVRRVLDVDTDLVASRYLPEPLLTAVLGLPFTEVLGAFLKGELIGVHVNLLGRSEYYIWQVGHAHEFLSQCQQSHFLYEASTQRAQDLDYLIVDAGRSPYRSKLEHGFAPHEVYFSTWSADGGMHESAKQWVTRLSERHVRKYAAVLGLEVASSS